MSRFSSPPLDGLSDTSIEGVGVWMTGVTTSLIPAVFARMAHDLENQSTELQSSETVSCVDVPEYTTCCCLDPWRTLQTDQPVTGSKCSTPHTQGGLKAAGRTDLN